MFIRCHAKQTDSVLLFKKLTPLEPASHPLQSEAKLKSYFHLIKVKNWDDHFIESNVTDLIEIQATCDGLVLATLEKNKGLILMNPVTRKHKLLPLGLPADNHTESYGVAICKEGGTCKVFHNIYDRTRGMDCCEVLSICTRKWTRVEGPPELLREISSCASPVSIDGSLHWMPRDHSLDYLVSINMKDENFITKKLPAAPWCYRLDN